LLEEVDGVLVGSVQVVEEDQPRRLGAHGLQQGTHRLVHPPGLDGQLLDRGIRSG
jgi:hypothetical protein